MSTLDIVVFIIMAIYVVKGFLKGILIEIFILLGFVLGIIGALQFTHAFINILPEGIAQSPTFNFASYFIVFIGIFVLMQWAGKFIEKSVKFLQLNFMNRLAGAAFGFVKIAFFISMGIWLFDRFHLIPEDVQESSLTYEALSEFAPQVIGFITESLPLISDIIEKIEQSLQDLPLLPGAHDTIN